jgi:hypothetical protein
MAAQDFRRRRRGGVMQAAKGMQHGADAQQRPQVVQGPGRRRQNRIFVGGKIERFVQAQLASAGYGDLLFGRQSGACVYQVAEDRATDPNLIARLQLLLGDRRTSNKGAVAAVQVLERAILASANEEAVAA